MKKRNIWIAVVVVLVGLMLALAYGLFYTREHLSPDVVVTRFYTEWITLSAGSSTAPVAQGLHTKSMYVTESFGHEVERAFVRGSDAVLCGISDPDVVEIDMMRINEKDTNATVFARVRGTVLHIILTRDELGWWRIDEVDCPNSNSGTSTTTSLTM